MGVVFLGVLIFLLGLPGRIAVARNHPEADAVYWMGWLEARSRVVEVGLPRALRARPKWSTLDYLTGDVAARDRRDGGAAQGRA